MHLYLSLLLPKCWGTCLNCNFGNLVYCFYPFYNVKWGRLLEYEINNCIQCWYEINIDMVMPIGGNSSTWRGHGHVNRGKTLKKFISSKKRETVILYLMWSFDDLTNFRRWYKRGQIQLLEEFLWIGGTGEYDCYHQKGEGEMLVWS